jgi:hypothetical protein
MDFERFWDGRREAEADAVQKYIPFVGSCNTPALENYRVFVNMYYRFYNDGDHPHASRMTSLAKKAGIANFKYAGGRWAVKRDLERIGDGLLDAALAEIESGIAQPMRGAA